MVFNTEDKKFCTEIEYAIKRGDVEKAERLLESLEQYLEKTGRRDEMQRYLVSAYEELMNLELNEARRLIEERKYRCALNSLEMVKYYAKIAGIGIPEDDIRELSLLAWKIGVEHEISKTKYCIKKGNNVGAVRSLRAARNHLSQIRSRLRSIKIPKEIKDFADNAKKEIKELRDNIKFLKN